MEAYLGVVSATALLFVTTADDAIWITHYLSPHYTRIAVLSHALSFCLTIQLVVWCMGGVCYFIEHGMMMGNTSLTGHKADLMLERLGCSLAWIVAFFFCYKAYQKKQRKAKAVMTGVEADKANRSEFEDRGESGAHAHTHAQHLPTVASYGAIDDVVRSSMNIATSSGVGDGSNSGTDDDALLQPETPPQQSASFSHILTCVWLTLIGCLDEVSYFPSLILTKTYTIWQLSIGAACACLLILGAITLARNLCAPWLELFDKVPLYVVTLSFAVYLTLEMLLGS